MPSKAYKYNVKDSAINCQAAYVSKWPPMICYFVASIRLTAFLLLSFLILSILLVLSGLTKLGLSQSLSSRLARYTSTFFMRAICMVINLQVENGSAVSLLLEKTKPSLILSNHISYLDIIVIGSQYPMAFLAKDDVKDWPIIGAIAKLIGTLFVTRDDMSSRIRSIYNIKDRLKSSHVCVFPEGSTTQFPRPSRSLWQSGQLAAAKLGGAQTLLLGVAYQDQENIAWIDDMDFVSHLWKIFQRPSVKTRLDFDLNDKLQSEPGTLRHISYVIADAIGDMSLKSYHNLN